jgi:beta-lactamase class A
MQNRGGVDLIRWGSIILLILAVILFFVQLFIYSRSRSLLPAGLSIAGVPVGRLDRTEAVQRLLQVYSAPVELHYDDQVLVLSPSAIGYRLDTEGMIAAAEFIRTRPDFWGGFWDFLWSREGPSEGIPLRSEYSRAQLEASLRDIGARYDQPPSPVQPVPGSTTFVAGTPGRVLDVARGVELVGLALNAPANRVVNLPVAATGAPRPTLDTLRILLQQNVDVAGFDGLLDMYVMDLRTGDELHFAYYGNQEITASPDISFTAASIIKIGIAVSFYRYFDEPLDAEAGRWISEMIRLSGNDPADWLMERIDRSFGPLRVTETLSELGLDSTFLVGYFRPLSPLLAPVPRTPGNTRPDIRTDPLDPYNQTTPAEMGMLMADIYACAEGGGTLIALYPDGIRPEECRRMLDLLAQNKIGILIEAGVPDGTRVAHKHGWTESPLAHVGDVGVVYSPAGDYVVSIFLWDDVEMVWDPTSRLVASLSRAVYNYFNPPSP